MISGMVGMVVDKCRRRIDQEKQETEVRAMGGRVDDGSDAIGYMEDAKKNRNNYLRQLNY